MDFKKQKILIIEDDEDGRLATRTYLELAGHRTILEAEDGNSGLALIRAQRPTLVLLDRKMPGKDGLQVLEEIKENYGDDIVVVMLTAFRDKGYITDAMRKGAYNYVVKDEDPDYILHTVESALQYHQKLQQRKAIEQEIYELMVEDEEHINNGYRFDYFRNALQEKVSKLFSNVIHTKISDCTECKRPGTKERNSVCFPEKFGFFEPVLKGAKKPILKIFHAGNAESFFRYACENFLDPEKQEQVKTLIFVGFVDKPSEKLASFLADSRAEIRLLHYCCIYIFSADRLELSLEEKRLLQRFFDRFLIAMRMAKLVDQFDSLQRNRLLGEIAATIVHKISPMIAPLMNCFKALDAEKCGDGVKIVKALRQVVDEFRDYNEGIRQEYKSEPVKLAPIFRRSELLISLKYDHVIQFEHKFPENMPLVIGDTARLEQAFAILLMNAAQAISAANRTQGKIEIEVYSKEPDIVVRIRDNGAGVPEEVQKLLFHSHITTKKSGMGLGLCLTHEIIRRHGGRIEYNKHYSDGAEFVCFLPLY